MSDEIIAKRYKVESELGSGGTAVVYKVRDLKLNEHFALKTLTLQSSEDIIRFQREAKAVSKLKHPNIVSVLDFGVDSDNTPFLVMEYVNGLSLRQYMKKNGPLPEEIAIKIIDQICDAMGYTHKHDILHRDLKPSNIMVVQDCGGADLKIQILDFGLAKGIVGVDDELTKPGIAIGTPHYMSPEQANGLDVDERSDVYALGCVMFEALTGSPPFQGKDALEIINQHMRDEAPRLSEQNGDTTYSPEMEEIVSNCLAKEPEDRFSSMNDLKNALETLFYKDEPIFEEPEEAVRHQEEFSPHEISFWNSPGVKVIVSILVIVLIGVGFLLSKIQNSEKATTSIKLKVDTNVDTSRTFTILHEFDKVEWEAGIPWWKKMYSTDEDVFALKKDTQIKYLSLYRESELSKKALFYAAGLPVIGLGLGKLHLHGDTLRKLTEINPKLEAIYLQDNRALVDEDLNCLVNLKNLKFLGLTRNNFTDKGLQIVSKIKTLQVLKIDYISGITNDGIKALTNLPDLRCLVIGGNRIDKKGWQIISKMRKLHLLSAINTNMTDQDLKILAKMRLQKLDVSQNPITEKGLEQLVGFSNLRVLRIESKPPIASEHLIRFLEKRPDCKIIKEFRTRYSQPDTVLMADETLKVR